MKIEQLLFSTPQACKLLGVNRYKLDHMRIPYVLVNEVESKNGKTLRFKMYRKEDLEEYINSRLVE